MSLACESMTSAEDQDTDLHSHSNQGKKSSEQIQSKDSYEDEELDFEEEMVDSSKNKSFIDDDGGVDDNDNESGELNNEDDNSKSTTTNKKCPKEKDEGEIDSDDELEEGEVKEENSDEEEKAQPKETAEKPPPTQRTNSTKPIITSETHRNNTRTSLLGRPPPLLERKMYYNVPQFWNQRYPNVQRVDRYNNPIVRTSREPALLPSPSQHHSQSSESAWERGLKQARELISRASKRKEEEEDFEHKRYNMSLKSDRSPPQPPIDKRRRYSQNSSSEDEIERRHRLAYDSAPWNNPSSNSQNSSSGHRSRSNNYSSNTMGVTGRSAETYRDPWRRSKSPKNVPIRNRTRDLGVDARYGEVSKYDKSRSDSVSSLSSICSSSSFSNGSEKSTGRKLPYTRPTNVHDDAEDDKGTFYERTYNSGNVAKTSRFDRIPKKSHALAPPQTSTIHDHEHGKSDQKSIDSWSESLSDSDSDSSYPMSDSDDQNNLSTKEDSRALSKQQRSTNSTNRTQSKINESNRKTMNYGDQSQYGYKTKEQSGSGKMSKYAQHAAEANKPIPIKMTFMKKQQSLKTDTVINEQLNGGMISDPEDEISNFSRISNTEGGNRNQPDTILSDEEDDRNDDDLQISPSSPSPPPKDPSKHRREELLLRLQAVEEAIQRKLQSKN